MITSTDLVLIYPDRNGVDKRILDTVSCEIPRGRITAFIGRSGAGKTSLLRCIGGLETGYQGSLTYHDAEIKSLSTAQRAEALGFVFQQFNLFPHMTLLENCINPGIYRGLSRDLVMGRALKHLETVGMLPYKDFYPRSLSGGQKQRGAIARALVAQPQVLLFDEPTSALDPESSATLVSIITRLASEGITIIFSSHDMRFIRESLDRVYFMADGKIVESHDSEEQSLDPNGNIARFLAHQ